MKISGILSALQPYSREGEIAFRATLTDVDRQVHFIDLSMEVLHTTNSQGVSVFKPVVIEGTVEVKAWADLNGHCGVLNVVVATTVQTMTDEILCEGMARVGRSLA